MPGPPGAPGWEGHDVPGWAMDLKDDVSAINGRLSRIEGGLALAAVILGLFISLIASHVLTIS